MKKLSLFFVLFIFGTFGSGLLTSCGKSPTDPQGPTATPTATPSTHTISINVTGVGSGPATIDEGPSAPTLIAPSLPFSNGPGIWATGQPITIIVSYNGSVTINVSEDSGGTPWKTAFGPAPVTLTGVVGQ